MGHISYRFRDIATKTQEIAVLPTIPQSGLRAPLGLTS